MTQLSFTSAAHGDDASSPVRPLAAPLLRAERRLEELIAARDNAPMRAAANNRKALEGRFERERRS